MWLHVLCFSLNSPPYPLQSSNIINPLPLNLLSLSLSLSQTFSDLLKSCISLQIFKHSSYEVEDKARMRNPSISRQKLLKKWIRVLQICTSSKKEMSIVERTRAIKLSADLAMASSRKGRTNWSRAIISDQANWNAKEKLFSQTPLLEKLKRASNKLTTRNLKLIRRKILQKSNRLAGGERKFNSNSLAKRWIQKKTQILRRLIPGGESVEENYLIEESLDYISSLRAQIDIMRCLVISNDAAKQ